MTRNQRRKAAQARLVAKTIRVANASEAARQDANRKLVNENLSRPIERNYYPQSSLNNLQQRTHTGYVSTRS